MAPRSRTGCLTCRQRKLKCSEERPVCAQCIKANRECVPSSGITFRHQQNPSLNGAEESLKNFYGYKETFARGTRWVPVPRDLTFVHTSNPYEDEEERPQAFGRNAGGEEYPEAGTSFMTDSGSGQMESEEYRLAQAAYHPYATHGLEALSAVASQDQYSYALPPTAPMGQQEQQQEDATTTQTLREVLSQAAGMGPPSKASNIDPRLHGEAPGPRYQEDRKPPDQNNEQVGASIDILDGDNLADLRKEHTLASIEEQLLKAQS